jgi:putative ATPase
MGDLFSHQREVHLARLAPLAERLRPRCLEDFVGQEAILGPGRLLRRAIAADRVGNVILHGPPGVGKTTLARIIAASTRSHFSSLNAVLAGIKDLRAAVEAAQQRLERHGLRSTLFIDEVHRFNSAQQDALLPWVENGTLTLIGATTENPFFEVNKALLSRSRLFRMQPLEPAQLQALLQRALTDRELGYGDRHVAITPEAADHLVDVASGDARSLLNALELAVETTEPNGDGLIQIDLTIAEESIQQRAVLYDKQGDAHFDTISAFIKSLRGSDPDAALFWLARMVEAGENPRFIFRRLLISAGEDIGLADPQAMVVVEACAAAFERVGLPEGLYPLAQASLYLASAEKSNSLLGVFDALRQVRNSNGQQVPPHLRDANRDGKAFGDGVGYRYPHAYAEHWVAQQYLPKALQGEVFWQPGGLGWEGAQRQRLQLRRAAQLAAAAETELEQGELISAGPADGPMEQWLRRQAAAEGERLDGLRRRFWQGGPVAKARAGTGAGGPIPALGSRSAGRHPRGAGVGGRGKRRRSPAPRSPAAAARYPAPAEHPALPTGRASLAGSRAGGAGGMGGGPAALPRPCPSCDRGLDHLPRCAAGETGELATVIQRAAAGPRWRAAGPGPTSGWGLLCPAPGAGQPGTAGSGLGIGTGHPLPKLLGGSPLAAGSRALAGGFDLGNNANAD